MNHFIFKNNHFYLTVELPLLKELQYLAQSSQLHAALRTSNYIKCKKVARIAHANNLFSQLKAFLLLFKFWPNNYLFLFI